MSDETRTDFNPSNSEIVREIKSQAQTLIDFIKSNVKPGREQSLAITNIEQGAMWAVKAATADLAPVG